MEFFHNYLLRVFYRWCKLHPLFVSLKEQKDFVNSFFEIISFDNCLKAPKNEAYINKVYKKIFFNFFFLQTKNDKVKKIMQTVKICKKNDKIIH